MHRGLRVITLQGAMEESPILVSQYWKNQLLDGTIIISYFDGSNNIFAEYILFAGIAFCAKVHFDTLTMRYNLAGKNRFANITKTFIFTEYLQGYKRSK